MDYYPIVKNKPTKAVEILLVKGKECGFAISIHGVKRRKSRTYLGCKVQGCKSRFSKVRDWNSHHRRIHAGIRLECDTCKKTFKTLSFFYGITNMHIRIHGLCVKNATNALCLKASIEYIDEHTYVVEYTNALQGPVEKNINGHRTCIDTYKCTWIINMDVRCVTTLTHRSTSSDGISENTVIPHIINVKIACSNASITHS